MIPLAICCIPISAILWVLFFSDQIFQVLISELYVYFFKIVVAQLAHMLQKIVMSQLFTCTCVHTLMPTYVLVHILFLVNL